MKLIERCSLIIIIIASLNLGFIGLFNFNLFGAILGQESWLLRLFYFIVGFCAIIFITYWIDRSKRK